MGRFIQEVIIFELNVSASRRDRHIRGDHCLQPGDV